MPPPERQTPHGGGFMGEMDMGTSPQSLATVLATPVSDYRGKAGDVFPANRTQFPCAVGRRPAAGDRGMGLYGSVRHQARCQPIWQRATPGLLSMSRDGRRANVRTPHLVGEPDQARPRSRTASATRSIPTM